MSLNSTATTPHPLPNVSLIHGKTFGAIYLQLLRPDSTAQDCLRKMKAAACAYEPHLPGSQTMLEHHLSALLHRPVQLSKPQLHALKLLAESPAFTALSPWSAEPQLDEMPEMAPASSLQDIYLALLKPDGWMMKRFKAVQNAAALYEPGTPGSQDALHLELSRLVGRPVELSEPQLRCFKELLIDEPAFAHIAPWEDLTASW